MDLDRTAPDDDDVDDRKPTAPKDNDDDYDADCFPIKLAWRDSITISAIPLPSMYLNPTFTVKNNLYIRLNHGSKISCFPDPDAFQILRKQSMQLKSALETQTDKYLQVEGVGHVGAIQR